MIVRGAALFRGLPNILFVCGDNPLSSIEYLRRGENQKCDQAFLHRLHNREWRGIGVLRIARSPVNIFYRIGENHSGSFHARRKWDFEGIAFTLIGDREHDSQAGFPIVEFG